MTTDREQSDADQVSNSDKLDRLIDATQGLTESNTGLATAMVEYQERARLARIRFRWTMGAVGVVALAALAGIYVQLFIAAQARAQLADCIKSTGHCYQQQQDRTAAVVAAIVDAITANNQKVAARAAACAPAYVTLPLRERKQAIYECIVRSN